MAQRGDSFLSLSVDSLEWRASRLAHVAVFREFSFEARRRFVEASRILSLDKGEYLWQLDDAGADLAVILEGELSIVRDQPDRICFRRLVMNDVVGVTAIVRAPASADVIASESSRLLMISGETLRASIPAYPEIAFKALSYMAKLVASLTDELQQHRFEDLESRVVRCIQAMSAGRKELKTTHKQLAEHVGAHRESVTRALRGLEDRGAIRCHRGRIEILNRETL